jgi:seryl-tRNA synthetase
MTATRRRPPQRRVWDTSPPVSFRGDTRDPLSQAGPVFVPGAGGIGFAPPMVQLIDYLDHRLRGLAGQLGADEHRYPTLLPTEIVDRSGYRDSFPHLLMSASTLDGGRYCLPPAACLHTYRHYLGATLTSDAPTVVTSRCRVFRHEQAGEDAPERLRDFTVREIVFLGEPAAVRQLRRSAMDLAHHLVEELGLSGYTEVATDPFFTPDHAERELAQLVAESKYELRLWVSAERSVAVASFNHAGRVFTDRFAISSRSDGQAAASGCAGFGLERWAYAFARQHGTDDSCWPEAVQRWMTRAR